MRRSSSLIKSADSGIGRVRCVSPTSPIEGKQPMEPRVRRHDTGPNRKHGQSGRGLIITDGAMSDQRRPGKYPDELRERAVRMVYEAERDCGSQWEAISSVAEKLGPTPETVRKWVRRTEIDTGRRPGAHHRRA